jgi:hypothetical protein
VPTMAKPKYLDWATTTSFNKTHSIVYEIKSLIE